MTRFLRRLSNTGLAILATAVILTALLSLTARLLLPHADGLRATLVERIGETLGTEVEVGALSIQLRGVDPELAFTDARLLEPGASASGKRQLLLTADSLRIDLDLIATLAAGRPRVEAITLVGAEIHVVRDTDGRLRVLGLDAMKGDDAAALDFFLREGRFRLVDSRLFWRDENTPGSAQGFCVELAEVDNHGGLHRARLRARPDRDPTGELQLLSVLEGPADAPERWSGQVYLSWLGTDLGAIVNQATSGPLALHSETILAESWNRLSDGRVHESLTQVTVGGLELDNGGPLQSLALGDFSALARWRRTGDDSQGWRLDVSDLQLFGSRPDSRTSARVSYLERRDGEDLQASDRAELFAAIGAVPIGPAAEVVGLIAPDLPDAITRLAEGRISGLARNLAVNLSLGRTGPDEAGIARGEVGHAPHEPALPAITDWRLRAEVNDLAVADGAGLPAFAGLDLNGEAGPNGGRINLHSTDARIDLRPLFAQPHQYSRISGDFSWRTMPAGSIHLWTPALRIETTDFESLSRLRLCVHPSGANPSIDLLTHLRNGHVDALKRWLPVGIMHEQLEGWLNRAIVDGRLESADLLLRGPLDHFPFDDNQGRFVLVLRTVDGVLDYGARAPSRQALPGMSSAVAQAPLDWPPLRDIAATLRFENRSLEIDISSAEILNTRVDTGRARLGNLWQPRYIEIEGSGEGPLADGKHVLATTPLARKLGGLAAAAEVSGRGQLALELDVPLKRELPFRYSGTLTMSPPAASAEMEPGPRTLALNGTDFRFADITGKLRFDETGVNARAIQARLDQQALEVDVESLGAGTEDARTRISLSGRTPSARLRPVLDPTLTREIDGNVDWTLALDLNNRDASQPRVPIDFTLTSSLLGLTVSTPAPIGKRRDESRPMRLSGRYQGEWPLPIQFDYGDVGALLELDQANGDSIKIQRAAVDLNGRPKGLPARGSIRIGGQLKQLELEPWIDWAKGSRRQAGPADKPALRLLPIELGIDDLRFHALQLSNVDVVMTPEAQGAWMIGFSAAETGTGEVRLPPSDDARATSIQLERLDIEPLTRSEGEDKDRKTSDPRGFGRIDLEINGLYYGDDLLGLLEVASEPVFNGVRFDEISLQGPHVQASGSGQWLTDPTDYAESSLAFRAESEAIGELLRETGFYSALSGAPGTLSLDLQWPGGPANLSLERVRGTIAADIGKGRMLDMEPGVGRMLGVLNTGALSRRLSLDFSDVFDDGFGFDSITGSVSINSGDARIRQLRIASPPADIEITGQTDLVDGQLDQRVEVTPKIGTGLAVAGVVAGGPVVGAAVFLADKVTDGGFERLGRYAYRVKGSWRDPDITRVGTSGTPALGDLFVDELRPGYRG